ncbi:MAG: PAS domain-containing protein, partial [Bacteroidetes bacterium]|nr:PAS domain-containing protein [Bacteroidota bacterium]
DSNSGLASDFVTTITADKANNLWFGTLGNGVSRYDGQALSYYTTVHGLPGNHVRTIFEDKKENLWIGTDRNGLSRYDGNTFVNYGVAQGLPNNNIWCGNEDKYGNLWFGTYGGGISCYDGKNFKNYSIKQGLPSDKILFIINDRKGNVWFGTDTGGVVCYDGTAFINYTTSQGLVNNSVWCGYEDKKGNLWFGTSGGISCYNGKMFINYTSAQGIGSNTVLCAGEDRKGNLWFGTDGDGLLRYDGKNFYAFTTRNGLVDDVVYDIVIDKQNDVVLGTNLGVSVLKGFAQKQKNGEDYNGINKIAPNSGVSNAELKKYYSPIFENYSEKTGYPIKDINANAMFCDSKGIIWAGCGDNKLVRFDYAAVFKDTLAPVAFIQSLKINNVEINWYDLLKYANKQNNNADTIPAGKIEEVIQYGHALNSEPGKMTKALKDIQFKGLSAFNFLPINLVLPYNDNEITFDFSAIAPASYPLLRYQYKLEGYDKEWSPITDKTTATFGNIPEGKYVFSIKACNVLGVWSKPVSYSFKVLPPWYRTWWAYCLYALFLLSLIRSYAYWREKKLQSEKARLQEIVKEQQRAEEKIKHSEIRLRQAQEIAHLGSWEVNFVTGVSTWSEEACRIYGLAPNDNSQTFESWQSFIHPDDFDYVMKMTKDSEASLSNTAYFHRIVRRDGTVRHVYSQAQYEFNEEGKPTGIYGVVHDITELKEHEEEVRKSNERFKLVMKATREAIIDWDIESDTTVWGDAFYELFGYSQSTSHDHLWSENIHPDDKARVMSDLQKAMHNKSNDVFFAEFRFLKANREVAYVQHTAIFIRDKNGKPIRAIASMVDVTTARERLRKIEAQNAALKEIAWIQAHLVRAPLASLMGLVALMKYKEEYGINEADLIEKIETEARNLDEIINTIVKKAEAIKSDLKDD